MLLSGFGPEGQRRLSESRALIVGCGALGCAIADLIARAGVGTVTLVDRDIVELTNLQRQTLFDESDAAAGVPKAEAARRRLSAVNSSITIHARIADFTASNAPAIVGEAIGESGVILDGTDNFETRYLLNDLAVSKGLPYVYGGAVATRGMAMTIIPGKTPCLRCLFEEPPPAGSTPTCDTVGVFGPIIAVTAAHQAADAIKVLLGQDALLSKSLLEFDLWTNQHRSIELAGPRSDCPCCGERRFEFLQGGRGSGTTSLCGQDAVQISPPAGVSGTLNLDELATRLRPHGEFAMFGRFLIRGQLASERGAQGKPVQLTVFADGRAIIRGTAKPEIAKSIYARYVGA